MSVPNDLYFIMRDSAKQIESERDRLKAENEKLQELAGIFVQYLNGDLRICDVCHLTIDCENHPAFQCPEPEMEDEILRMMRNWGVVVD